jgi:uncharacterized membrane protein YoaK (UPF0700 family)
VRPLPSFHDLRWGLLISLVGVGVVVESVVASWSDLGTLVVTHERTIAAFVLAIVAGELARIRMPSGRETAPLASAAALGVAFLGPVDGEPPFDVPAGAVVLVVAVALGIAAVVRRLRGRDVGAPLVTASLLGVALAAELARETGPEGRSLWDLQRGGNRASVALVMVLVAALGLVVEVVLASAARAEQQGSPWSAALRDELGEAAPLNFAVIASGPMIALIAPVFGLASIPAALFPLAITYVAVFRFARNRATYRQTIATLSLLTDRGGYTRTAHAERVAETSVRVGRVLGLSERVLRDLEYAALLHDLGQISLREPIPDGATVLAAPADQRDIAAEGARIIRHAEGLDTVAAYVEGQTTPYRLVRELGEPVPMPSRILKVANAYDDLTGGSVDPARTEAAMERIHLGLGYEYDPDVVAALTRVATSDAGLGRLGTRDAASR